MTIDTAAIADVMVPAPFRVSDRREETADTATIVLEAVDGETLSFRPGQFNMLAPFGIGEAAISIAGHPDEPHRLVHTIRSVGPVTRALTSLTPGDVVGVRGPFGQGWPLEVAEGRDLVFVAGGIGLAPLRPAILRAFARRRRYGNLWVLYGARTPADLLFVAELREWRARFDAEVEVTVDRAGSDWHGDVGVVTRFLPYVHVSSTAPVVMACGPEIMMQVVADRIVQVTGAASDIYLSLERNMKCGVGMCGHCQFGPDFICRQGPVLPYSVLESRLRVREL